MFTIQLTKYRMLKGYSLVMQSNIFSKISTKYAKSENVSNFAI